MPRNQRCQEDPYFKIPVERIIVLVLHARIGIGNQILKHFVDIVDLEVEYLPDKEV